MGQRDEVNDKNPMTVREAVDLLEGALRAAHSELEAARAETLALRDLLQKVEPFIDRHPARIQEGLIAEVEAVLQGVKAFTSDDLAHVEKLYDWLRAWQEWARTWLEKLGLQVTDGWHGDDGAREHLGLHLTHGAAAATVAAAEMCERERSRLEAGGAVREAAGAQHCATYVRAAASASGSQADAYPLLRRLARLERLLIAARAEVESFGGSPEDWDEEGRELAERIRDLDEDLIR